MTVRVVGEGVTVGVAVGHGVTIMLASLVAVVALISLLVGMLVLVVVVVVVVVVVGIVLVGVAIGTVVVVSRATALAALVVGSSVGILFRRGVLEVSGSVGQATEGLSLGDFVVLVLVAEALDTLGASMPISRHRVGAAVVSAIADVVDLLLTGLLSIFSN